MKKLLLISSLLISANCYAIPDYETKSTIYVSSSMAFPGNPTTVFADIYNEVTNNTDEPIWIMAHYNLDIEYCGKDYHQWKVKVNPHGTWHDHWRPQKECIFPSGNYSVAAQGAIDGVTVELHDENWGYANVSVR